MKKELPNLYILRFLLSITVIIYHIPMISGNLKIPYYNDSPIFEKGPLAVYYFFTLSGFLIFRALYTEIKKTNQLDFKKFYMNRMKRLFPVYYLVFFIGLVLYEFILPQIGIYSKKSNSIFELIINYLLLIPNVYKYYYPNVGSILIVLWSIGVEVQFYIFIPIFLYIFKENMIKSMIVLLIILLLILLFYPIFYSYGNYFYLFLGGGLLSILSLNFKITLFQNKILHYSIYLLFILSFFTNWFNFENIFAFHFFNLVISSLMISFVSDYPIFIIKSKKLDYFGKISYGIYMYHMIVITLLLFIIDKTKLYNYLNDEIFIIILNLVIIFFTILLSHFSFKYFESRFFTINTAKYEKSVAKP